MNKKMFKEIADDAGRRATIQLYKELESTAQQIAKDQSEWLDSTVKLLLPPDLYDAGRRGERSQEIAEYLIKHKIQIIFIPDRQSIEIHVKGEKFSAFETRILVDGEPIPVVQTKFGLN